MKIRMFAFPVGAVVFLLVALLTSSCTNTVKIPKEGVEVTVSLPVVAYFVERIGGDKVVVNTMIPQSVSHDAYTPLPNQMKELANSSTYMALGPLDFELTWRDRLMSAAPQMRWVRLDHDIELIAEEDDEHGEKDPHYWLSPRRAAQMALNISVELKALMPAQAQRIDSATSAVLADLKVVADRFESIKSGEASKTFVVFHPALGYLASDYGLCQLAIEHHGSAPTPRTYMDLIEKARAAGVKVVFVQQGYDTAKTEALAKEIGASIVKIFPEDYDWKKTIDTILEALR